MARPTKLDRDSVRSMRLTVAISPADYSGLEVLASISGKSVNQIIAELVSQVVKKNSKAIEDFAAEREKYQNRINLDVDGEKS